MTTTPPPPRLPEAGGWPGEDLHASFRGRPGRSAAAACPPARLDPSTCLAVLPLLSCHTWPPLGLSETAVPVWAMLTQ